jgi:anaerobic magnesium-protoporphyrin IX monomethyl ester cyclase
VISVRPIALFEAGVMNIVLINPPNVLPGSALLSVRAPTPSTSIPYLSAILQSAGYSPVVIDALGLGLEKVRPVAGFDLNVRGLIESEIVERLPRESKLVGISCMYSNEWVFVRRLIKRISTARPGLPIVIGGEHVTADVSYIFSTVPEVDYAVLGEGEETFVDLLDTLFKSEAQLSSVDGIAFRGMDGKTVLTGARKRISDIDQIPWPSWEGVPLEKYFQYGAGITSFQGRVMPILATRGCPYTCTFCSNPQMWGIRWKSRDVEDVVLEMKHYIRKYGVTHFEFHDLTAIVNKRWTLKFTAHLIEENIGVTWSLPSGTRSEALDKEVLSNLYRSGCRKISYAPESGSRKTLERIKKKVDLRRMLRSMAAAVDVGILVRAHIIFGFPGQGHREIRESIYFIIRMAWVGIHDVSVYLFVPYPGSELFQDLQASGKIPKGGLVYKKF